MSDLGPSRGGLAGLVRFERERRGLSRRALAAQIRRAGRGDGLTTGEQTVKGWERGVTPTGASMRALATVLDRPVGDLVDLAREAHAPAVPLPLLRPHLLGQPDDLGEAVARLRTAYPRLQPGVMLAEIEGDLAQVRSLLEAGGRGTRDVLAAAGWLHLLAGTARFDLFDRPAARLYRSEAERLARKIGDAELLGWTYETAAHFALVAGEFRDAVRHARAGQHAAPARSTAELACHLQEARCWSQLGAPADAIAALDRAGAIFERQPQVGQPGDHYGFDAAKFGFFAATTYAEVGRTAEAEQTARSVVAACGHRPNTAANSRVTLALALVQRGELDEAAHEAAGALAGPRVHPDTLRRAREVGRFLAPHASVASVQDLQARLATFARRIANGGIE